MPQPRKRRAGPWVGLALLLGVTLLGRADERSTAPPNGLRRQTPAVHALVGARIVVRPGQVIESGTLVIRDGVIEALGPTVTPPPDARVWNLAGKTILPGLIDAWSPLEGELPEAIAAARGYWNGENNAHVRAVELSRAASGTLGAARGVGFTSRLIVPREGIVAGISALVALTDDADSAVLVPEVALHARLTPGASGRERQRTTPIGSTGLERYPTSPMGAVALVRQALYDARWYAQSQTLYLTRGGLPRPDRSAALASLARVVQGELPLVLDAPDEFYLLRADRLAAEFGARAIIRGSGREYRRLEAVKATGRAVIVPLNFSKVPDVRSPEGAQSVSLERLLHWDLAPENPGRLVKAGVRIAFTTEGLKKPDDFWPALRRAVRRGLSAEAALAALTTTPAELFGVADRLGALEQGLAASLVVASGDVFTSDEAQIVETWVDGARYEIAPAPVVDPRGTWELTLARPDGTNETVTLKLGGTAAKPTAKFVRGDKTTTAKHLVVDEGQWTLVVSGEALGATGTVRMSGLLTAGEASELRLEGTVVWTEGTSSSVSGKRTAPFDPQAEAAEKQPAASPPAPPPATPPAETAQPVEPSPPPQVDSTPQGAPVPAPSEPAPTAPAPAAPAAESPGGAPSSPATAPVAPAATVPTTALYDVNYPLGAWGRAAPPEQPARVAFRGGTVWTSGPAGILEGATVLVVAGRIVAVGTDVAVPDDTLVVDCTGHVVAPGIIDCHSHIATDGGVNESGQAITAEVRIGDFIDADDVNLYRQLAGGVTAANILHGSANPIGGQNQVIKFRWGALPEELKFAGAPAGIKFALGENVKQSNWGERFTTRYPQTRMGVEELIRDAFRAAQDYRRARALWERSPSGLPPRVDLELEALVEILAGQRLIHCHSYRQDEILMLLRLCESFDVRIATLQHILEGYKVADAIARHGAGGSSFSDWWAFKVEVLDAIPYNGALMQRAGVLMSFNSDDAELARRLNVEAAKSVKYGGLAPEEALALVTINPARQLRIAERTGSLEPGKDADLAVWTGSPLSSLSRVRETWVDGRKYFDRQADLARRDEVASMRAALVERALASADPIEGADDQSPAERDLWPREDLFCGHHDDDHDHEFQHHAAGEESLHAEEH